MVIDLSRTDQATFDALVTELGAKAYAELPFALPRATLVGAAERFFDFLTLPQKEELHFYDRPENRQGIGYRRRTKEYGDDKEFFHYHPKLLKEFAGTELIERPEVAPFLAAADEIYQEALAVSKALFHAISLAYPGVYERFFPTTEEYIEYSALRFLKYEPSGVGEFLARAHYDRGATTLALAESAPGLRIGKNEATLTEVVHRDQVALFMPAWQLRHITDDRFMPAWHDVVQSSEDVYRPDAARWAIVFFSDAPGVPVPSREESHRVI